MILRSEKQKAASRKFVQAGHRLSHAPAVPSVAPTKSWWLGCRTRDEFAKQAAEEAARMNQVRVSYKPKGRD